MRARRAAAAGARGGGAGVEVAEGGGCELGVQRSCAAEVLAGAGGGVTSQSFKMLSKQY